MRFLFASAHPYLPQIAGGTQSNTHEMARALIARGHAVAVLAGLMPNGRLALRNRLLMKLTGRSTWADRSLGYPVYRTWHAWEGAARCAAHFRPDIAVVQSGQILRMAGALRSAGVRLLIYNHNADFTDHGQDFAAFRAERFIANSRFTARTYRETFGVESDVVVPLFDRSRYAVASTRSEVLFVNPHPNKGVDTALELARRCPDIPFRFVESWTLAAEQAARLKRARDALPNLRLSAKTADMARHYARARIVLVPSRWAEAWGRVATEAHFSGIPVLASAIGGLPEAVGPGGVLVDPDRPIDVWVAELRRLWDDPEHYARLSAAALRFSERAEIDPALQTRRLEEIAAEIVEARA